jgi:hypothetical protein
LIGKASGRFYLYPFWKEEDLQQTVLHFLKQRKVAIASSCLGEGQCQKCLIFLDAKQTHLSCQITLQQLPKKTPLQPYPLVASSQFSLWVNRIEITYL